jgi:hypothetical protein
MGYLGYGRYWTKKCELWEISKYFLGHILSKLDFICPVITKITLLIHPTAEKD